MIYQKLKQIGKRCFGYEDIAKVLGISFASARVEASRFVKYGVIIRAKRNLYILREEWARLERNDFFVLANLLQTPSYVSLMSALDYYRITTQLQQGFVESVCIKRTKDVCIEEYLFNYTKIRRDLYFGFVRLRDFFIAKPEKAFLDALYLSLLGRYDFDLSSVDFEKLNWNRLKVFSKRFPERVKMAVRDYGLA